MFRVNLDEHVEFNRNSVGNNKWAKFNYGYNSFYFEKIGFINDFKANYVKVHF